MSNPTLLDNNLDPNHDYHSYANVEQIQVKHLHLILSVHFEKKTLSGSVQLKLEHHRRADNDELILDTRDLHIQSITDPQNHPLEYRLGETDEILGTPLYIKLPQAYDTLTIHYHSSPNAEGLQWIPSEATDNKQHPYLFSQSQPINCRSWIPLQDTPKARVTFAAEIQTPIELRAVMSAVNNPERNSNGLYQFSINKPIPTHLLAIAVGDLYFQKISERSGVYTEAKMLHKAAKEFEDVEQMIQTAEKLMGPYQWERFDMLVLPASFPFGGMENPCLTFLTPTLIAGDKSLVSTVAHELAHSWTGNLVSNATWRDLWINEGFTTYFTIRIIEQVYNRELGLFQLVLEHQRMTAAIKKVPADKQSICIDLRGDNPEDAFNAFAYVKGSMFIQFLDRRIGRKNFDKFLRNYIDHFAFQPITTEMIHDYIIIHLVKTYPDKVTQEEINEWIYGSGIPTNYPIPVSKDLNDVQTMINQWAEGKEVINQKNTSHWGCDHWLYFLGNLPETISLNQMQQLDDVFNFTANPNAEIAFKWFLLALDHHYEKAFPALKNYLTRIGRGKFIKPLYKKMSENESYREMLKEIYTDAHPNYHPSMNKQLNRLFL